jgi:hypothetical protein
MTETNKTIPAEQIEILKQFASEDEIEKFFLRLNYNYGGGEVLNFKQIESFFKRDMHKNTNTDILTVFIDTIRILRLVDKNEDEILGLDETSVMSLHDKLSSEYVGAVDKVKSAEYEKAVTPFNNLTGDYGNVKIELIRSLKELNHEGASMRHCIATYDDIIIRKQYVGFRVYNKNNGERLTLGCYRGNNSNELFFNQLKGLGNYPAKKDSCLAIIEFCNEKGIKIPDSEVFDLLPGLSFKE